MGGDNTAKTDPAIELIDIADESAQPQETPPPVAAEPSVAPAIRPGRRRPQVVPPLEENAGENLADNAAPPVPTVDHHTQQEQLSRAPGEPPLFSGILQLEPKDLKQWQKALKTHKKCSNMKKLSTLDYFAMRFSEVAYFEVSSDAAALVGVLGFGTLSLVAQIKSQRLSAELLPSLFGILTTNDSYCGPIEGLSPEDSKGLAQIGFQSLHFVGAFPVIYKKAITGVWLCGANTDVEMSEKELTALKKQFTNFVF